ncbi:MAG TPA: methionine synthase [Methylomirabilota bacterium]|nr:methionine synthase [Methylomirabilota bacterium]
MTSPGSDRRDELVALMRERILVLDGAMGTMLQSRDLDAADFGGPELEGCNEHLVVSRPDVVLDVHRAYLAAGAEIIETDTFGGTPVVLAEYGLAERARELNRRAAEIAVEAAREASSSTRPRFVAGSVGPTTKAISVTGGITFDELVAGFAEQAAGLLEGGVDLFAVETCQDTRNTKAALIAIGDVCRAAGVERPVIVSGTIELNGTMLGGQTAEAFVASIEHAGPLAVGLNCATGPEFMTDHLRSVHEMTAAAVSCYPNAGLPDEDGRYPETPDTLAAKLQRFADAGWLNLVGGCCGTTERHIAAIAAMVEGKRPRPLPVRRSTRVFFSGVDLVESTPENRPLLVGERTNVLGSRKFRRLVAGERWDEAAEIARAQVAGGAQIVDVCLTTTDRDELADIRAFYERLVRSVKAPLMIDATDPEAVELALTYCQGRAIVNSINLEDGEARFQAICPLLRRYGAAAVVGTIDEHPEDAQAFTRERKLEVALRSHELLTGTYGLADHDLVFDPLVFPAASGDAGYIGSAVETIEGLRLIKQALPHCRTVLGISNVSFGLPPAAREVVNSVFLYHCTKAGLDLAIVNSQGLERFASIPDDVRRDAEALLFNHPEGARSDDSDDFADVKSSESSDLAPIPLDWRRQTAEQREAINRANIARLTERFRDVKHAPRGTTEELCLDERLARFIIEGTREGLTADLDLKLAEGAAPLDIINGPLMAGMTEVGRLFNANQLIVAEVLQSAESMKAAVSHLEAHMDEADTASRGLVVLATVKGDVHDIGKNLVEILLANNGFEVVDLGIKVPPERLVAACREHRPDAVGLSGLLVKSAHQMVVTAEDLRAAGIEVPVLVGGAALSAGFTRSRIAPAYGGPVIYCADAMRGLEVMQGLTDPDRRQSLIDGLGGARSDDLDDSAQAESSRSSDPAPSRSSRVRVDLPLPSPPNLDRHVTGRVDDLRDVWSYLNPQMLYGKHLGLRGSFERLLAEADPTLGKVVEVVSELQAEAEAWMRVAEVWRFLEAEAEGNTVHLFEPGASSPVADLEFPRQPKDDGLCLADYVLPPADGRRDTVALFVVGAGEGVRERAAVERANGEYLRSHALQSLAVETAEAAAERLHCRLRELWGFPDPPELTMKERFRAAYRGKRYSPGYPACPDLDQQRIIWRLLDPDEIGVSLTDGMMMDPEASVSAFVFHHPECAYFSASGTRR